MARFLRFFGVADVVPETSYPAYVLVILQAQDIRSLKCSGT